MYDITSVIFGRYDAPKVERFRQKKFLSLAYSKSLKKAYRPIQFEGWLIILVRCFFLLSDVRKGRESARVRRRKEKAREGKGEGGFWSERNRSICTVIKHLRVVDIFFPLIREGTNVWICWKWFIRHGLNGDKGYPDIPHIFFKTTRKAMKDRHLSINWRIQGAEETFSNENVIYPVLKIQAPKELRSLFDLKRSKSWFSNKTLILKLIKTWVFTISWN